MFDISTINDTHLPRQSALGVLIFACSTHFFEGFPHWNLDTGHYPPPIYFVHIPVNGTEFTQLLSIRASRFSGLRACISLRNTIYNSQMPSSSFLHGHWQGEPQKTPPCFCLQTMKCTSPRFGQINFRGHIEHSVTPFLVSFITNSMDWIFVCLLSRSLLTKFHTALHTPPTPVAHDIPPPYIFI